MKKILLSIVASVLCLSISAQSFDGPDGMGPGQGMPPVGHQGQRPPVRPGDKMSKARQEYDKQTEKDAKKAAKRAAKEAKRRKKESEAKLVPQMYAYAIGVTPGDSVIYMSDVLILKNAMVTKKYGFLLDRQDYSTQFKSYLSEKYDQKFRTCALVFNKSLTRIDNDYNKLKKKYAKRKMLVKVVDQTEFRFTVPDYSDRQ